MNVSETIRLIEWADTQNEGAPQAASPVVRNPEANMARTVPNVLATAPTTALPESIMAAWTEIVRSEISGRLFNRLVQIAMQPAGWRGPGSQPLKLSSLRRFLQFWTQVRMASAEPELSLSPDGSLHAEWFKSYRQRLDITFSEPRILYGLFSNGEIAEGASTVDAVANSMLVHHAGPLAWTAL